MRKNKPSRGGGGAPFWHIQRKRDAEGTRANSLSPATLASTSLDIAPTAHVTAPVTAFGDVQGVVRHAGAAVNRGGVGVACQAEGGARWITRIMANTLTHANMFAATTDTALKVPTQSTYRKSPPPPPPPRRTTQGMHPPHPSPVLDKRLILQQDGRALSTHTVLKTRTTPGSQRHTKRTYPARQTHDAPPA